MQKWQDVPQHGLRSRPGGATSCHKIPLLLYISMPQSQYMSTVRLEETDIKTKSRSFFKNAGFDLITRAYTSGSTSCEEPVRACVIHKGLCTEEWWRDRYKEQFPAEVQYSQLSWRENYRLECQYGDRQRWDEPLDSYRFDIIVWDNLGNNLNEGRRELYTNMGVITAIELTFAGSTGHSIEGG